MKNRVIIEVSGGVPTVYTDSTNLDVVLVNWDTKGYTADNQGYTVVRDQDGRELLVHCCRLKTTPTTQLPFEAKAALDTELRDRHP